MEQLLQRVSILRNRARTLLIETSEHVENSGDNDSDAWALRQQATRSLSEAEDLEAALKAEQHHAAGSSITFAAAAEAAQGPGSIAGMPGIAAKSAEARINVESVITACSPAGALGSNAPAGIEVENVLPPPITDEAEAPQRQPSSEACAELAISAAAALYELGQRLEQREAEVAVLEGAALRQLQLQGPQGPQGQEAEHETGVGSRVQVQQQMQLEGFRVDGAKFNILSGEGEKAAAAEGREAEEDKVAEEREVEWWAAEEREAGKMVAEEGVAEA